jgi:HEAT repeat protein
VALAGHLGDTATARQATADADPKIRATALGALARAGALRGDDLTAAAADEAPVVRARAAELAAGLGSPAAVLIGLLADRDPLVVEAACFGLGEAGEGAGAAAVEALAGVCRAHTDPICREAAVAALGAIGEPSGLSAILAATEDKPAVRRRAVLALAPFGGPEVEAALARALDDRDWQVRQAAEDLVERD